VNAIRDAETTNFTVAFRPIIDPDAFTLFLSRFGNRTASRLLPRRVLADARRVWQRSFWEFMKQHDTADVQIALDRAVDNGYIRRKQRQQAMQWLITQ